MCTFTNFGGVTISIKHFALGAPFRYLTIRFTFISSLSVGQRIFRAVSLTLYMMSACSWCLRDPNPLLLMAYATSDTADPKGPKLEKPRTIVSGDDVD